MAQINNDPSCTRSFKGHQGSINSVHFDPNMVQLVSGGDDHFVMVWNFQEQNKRAFRFVGHTQPVTCVRFSPSGHLIASSSVDQTVRLWVPTIKGISEVLKCHHSPVRCVEFSRDGSQLITGADDKILKLWDTKEKKFVLSFAGHRNWVRCAGFDLGDKRIVSGSDDRSVKIWDKLSGKCIKSMENFAGGASGVGVPPAVGDCFAASFDDGSVRLWDLRTYKLLQLYQLNKVAVRGMAFHTSGRFILTASDDGNLRLLDLLEGRVGYTLLGHEGPVQCVSFSKDGDYFASGSKDKQVLLWQTNVLSVDIRKSMKSSKTCGETSNSANSLLTPSTNVQKLKEEVDSTDRLVSSSSILCSGAPVTPGPSNPPVPRGDQATENRMQAMELTIEKLSSTVDILVQTTALLEQKLSLMENQFEGLLYLGRHGEGINSPSMNGQSSR